MKLFPWMLAGVGLGLVAYVILSQPEPEYTTGSDTVEDAAGKASQWGSEQRLKGTGGGLVGKVKEGIGEVTGNEKLEGEGVADQIVGEVEDTVGKAAHAVGETIHDLNR